jgi:D-alanyl-D-alanine carboxypeptidase/D-alanyl-D-alanine-endopeptidase (penicillin-binding protein 4)
VQRVAAVALVAVTALVIGPLAHAADSLPSGSSSASSASSATGWSAISAESGTAPTAAGVRAQIARFARSDALRRSGVIVIDPGSQQTLFAKQEARPLTPASTVKILTAAAALEALGPNTRLATRVATQGDVVYLIGGGDATLPRALKTDSLPRGPASLRRLARDTATSLGTRTRVDVVFDDSLFSGRVLGPGWPKGFPAAGVAAPVTALMINQGRRAPSSRARVDDPARKAAQAFATLLEKRGVQVNRVSRGLAPLGASEIARVESATVTEIVKAMLTDSDNDVAESLGHLVGKEMLDDGSFAGGAQATTMILQNAGVDVSNLALVDASGLSGRNKATPSTIGDVLVDVVRGERWPAIVQGLAVAGATGTLADRFATKATSAGRGVVRAKTGTLTGVGSLAGTVVDTTGRPLVFVVIGNGVRSQARARDAMDRIASELAECGCNS